MGVVYLEHDKNAVYPGWESAYSPSEDYPEYQFEGSVLNHEKNHVYEMVRNCLVHMGLDAENYGKSTWNPLSKYIKPGQTVLLKPNWVMHYNMNKKARSLEMECLVTHPSVVRAICDYCLIALKGVGKIIIADAPMQDCDLEKLFQKTHYYELFDFYKRENQPVEYEDLRYCQSIFRNGVIIEKKYKDGIGVDIDLGELSIHEKRIGGRSYQVDNYDTRETGKFHGANKHIYSINKDVLCADFIINICKPKSHRLAGYTAAMKNMVGICYSKASLPHRVAGSSDMGGDAYEHRSKTKRVIDYILEKKIQHENKGEILVATIDRFIYGGLLLFIRRFGRDPYIKGIWYGNDTIWRTVVDLNYIVRYADKDGLLQSTRQRNELCFGDMIVAGEHNGPCAPDPKKMGIILAAEDARDFDMAFSIIAGFANLNVPLDKAIKNSETDYLLGKLKPIELIMNGEKIEQICDFILLDEWKYKVHDAWAR